MADIIDKLQEDSAATAFQLIWGSVSRMAGAVVHEEAVQKGMQQYAQGFYQRCGQVKVLGKDEPIPLREIYAAARVVSPSFLQQFSTTAQSQSFYDNHGRRTLFQMDTDVKSLPALKLANEKQFLNVLGAPGAGKSTFLRRLGLEALLPRRGWGDSFRVNLGLKPGLQGGSISEYQHNCLPVFIELSRFRTHEIDLFRFIRNELANCRLPESDKLVEALLEQGRLLILLDGLDEVSGDKLDGVVDHIRDFIDRHDKNRFVTSCRTAFYKDHFPRFTDVVLADFDDEQIANFIRNWFRSERDREQGTAQAFLQLLQEPVQAATRELARTPLLLTFLCLAYDSGQQLPPVRSSLYREALEILLKKWTASKRVHNEPIYRELHSDLEVQMLADIAAPAFRHGSYFFTRRELTDAIASFLREELNAPKHLDSGQVLNAIEIQQGLIVQRARDVWSFSHLTIQEYLTAVWYVSKPNLGGLLEKMSDKRWREVFLLVAGLVGRADDLLDQMFDKAKKSMVSRPGVVLFLQWAGRAIHPAPVGLSSQSSVARHASAILALLVFSPVLHRSRMSDGDRSISLEHSLQSAATSALELVLALDPNLKFNSAGFQSVKNLRDRSLVNPYSYNHFFAYIREALVPCCRQFAGLEYFKRDWSEVARQLEALSEMPISSKEDLQERWRQLGEVFIRVLVDPDDFWRVTNVDNVRALEQYIENCKLIIECRRSATSVSRSTWDGLCGRMFRSSRAFVE